MKTLRLRSVFFALVRGFGPPPNDGRKEKGMGGPTPLPPKAASQRKKKKGKPPPTLRRLTTARVYGKRTLLPGGS